MKNTVILLIFLLAILGLIIGVHCTENLDSEKNPEYGEESINEFSDTEITSNLDNHESFFNDFFI